ncbi:MAG: membrane protein insertase YidC, partial [Alphaproteobacteria bacterium]|nr:membrane protein insertase YidC [Alphaproteobacteria bacterium]
EVPKMQEYEEQAKVRRKTDISSNVKIQKPEKFLSTENALNNYKNRVRVKGEKIEGSISLVGARIDDIILSQYHKTVDDKQLVQLLHPSRSKDSYFAEFGWLSQSKDIDLPDSSTVWRANKNVLKSEDSVSLTWVNRQGITFQMDIYLDKEYMFTIKKSIKNNSGRNIVVQDYSLINRIFAQDKKFAISHEGPLGVFNGILDEVSYEDLQSDDNVEFKDNKAGSWFGISDKYWLSAIIPDKNRKFDSNFRFSKYLNKDKYQVSSLAEEEVVANGSQSSSVSHLFVGAKVVSILDFYGQYLNLDLFDRAVDFGWFYFMTKPMFSALKFFYDVVGNFGLSILIVTIIVKMFLFPIANKSYHSMSKMKKLAPEMNRIKELYAEDKMKQNQAIMELYKKEGVSPLSGCLPLLVQIPIFFSLYKVLFITIEMRHAPFYGWIRDLSVADPTTIFNAFGLIPWDPPSFLMIGAWPLIMAFTMYIQQKMSPEPSDPIQAKVMKLLPLIFIFMFASFPAGLVIYWAWSNILSVAQQYFIKIRAYRKENLVI